jgi:UDP-galactopyranose mutase
VDVASPIVVFSHLRWDSVFQRPHHLMSRLARQRQVLFVEEPVPLQPGGRETWELRRPCRNLLVCRPHTRVEAPGFHKDQMPSLVGMTRRLLSWREVERHVAWLYTPMAVPLARALRPDTVVYDCMDELSAFLGAPPDLLDRESELLSWADVVFTGGPSLFRAKKHRHPRVHCFPSSVDAAHFRRGVAGGSEPAAQAALPRPRLGYYGVIDERLDLGLIDALAASNPSWQIVMVGPVVKIDPASLPRHPNLHYLGQRPYEELPAYVAGWDACLLPFARNAATRFISPTKTLEYMAAERPIVSTPIHDVVEFYGDIVYLGGTPDAFIAACRRALEADPRDRLRRFVAMREVLANTSWSSTVAAMANELETLAPAPARAPAPAARAPAPAPRPTSDLAVQRAANAAGR